MAAALFLFVHFDPKAEIYLQEIQIGQVNQWDEGDRSRDELANIPIFWLGHISCASCTSVVKFASDVFTKVWKQVQAN